MNDKYNIIIQIYIMYKIMKLFQVLNKWLHL